MTAVMSPTHSPSPSPQRTQFSPTQSPSLPQLSTSHPFKRTALQRPPSYAKNRMSSYSTTSRLSDNRSRPGSYAFPAPYSSLPYTLVRDFAFPITHPWHYGPPLEPSQPPSGNSTPLSERHRRLSDPSNSAWDSSNPQWSAGPWSGDGSYANQPLPQMAYGDGPPYSEDEDLHSPIVASRHSKSKSAFPLSSPGLGRTGRQSLDDDGYGQERNQNASLDQVHHRGRMGGVRAAEGEADAYYIGEEDETANAAGGELVTYPPEPVHQGLLSPKYLGDSGQQQGSPSATGPGYSQSQVEGLESDGEGSGFLDQDDSRYSRDYQFTIASPDEEMHGKAVALFDFARENENELPLIEGQIIWVSYRHGQGWLVAEDPKTGDAGLVPEEYVRLLRDIEGGWSSLNGEQPIGEEDALVSPVAPTCADAVDTPTQAESNFGQFPHSRHGSTGKEKRPPVVSSFSTSSKDLEKYPHHLPGQQSGAVPPAVVHQSQNNTPTVASPQIAGHPGHTLPERDQHVEKSANKKIEKSMK